MKRCILILFIGLLILDCNLLIAQQDSTINDISSDDSFYMQELKQKKEKELELLERSRVFQEEAIIQQEEAQKKQLALIYLGVLIFILVFATLIVLMIRNKKLRKLLDQADQKADTEKG